MPEIQNNQSRPGQQRARLYDGKHVGRGSPNPNDDLKNNLLIVIEKNIKLKDDLNQITEMFREKLKKSNLNVRTLLDGNKKLKMQLDDCEVKLVEAVQNYENAKVVVLTYKTRNIHLETAADELEVSLVTN